MTRVALFVLRCSCAALLVTASDGARGASSRSIPLEVPAVGRTGFTRLPGSTTGVLFTNSLIADRHLTNQILLNGSGVAAGDVDGDGLCDLYFCGLDSRNTLYRNRGGWRFEEVGGAGGAALDGRDSTGVALADLDADSDLDLVVNTLSEGTFIFQNNGRGAFTPVGSPLNLRRGAMSLALADVEGDGDLDLYVANYRTDTIRDQPDTRFTMRMVGNEPQVAAVNGVSVTHPDVANRFTFKVRFSDGRGSVTHVENGEPDVLYLNDGSGRFSEVPFDQGAFLDSDGRPLVEPPFDWGLSVMMRDLNGDQAPDIYVCNDFESPDRFWINIGNGRFRMAPPAALRHTPLSSMGVDVADLNRDGHDDILVVDMLSRVHERRFSQHSMVQPVIQGNDPNAERPQYARNMLFLSRGDGTYSEIADFSGLDATEWSWAPVFLDVDLDGFEDLLVSNGFERDGMNADALANLERMKRQTNLKGVDQLRLRSTFPRLASPNLAFRNQGNLRFEETGQSWGFDEAAVSHGMALADLDNDGDLDVVLNNQGTEAGLYRNETVAPRVAVRLRGLPPNTRGIGAAIELRGGPVVQRQEMIAGGRYLSSDDAIRAFAPGTETESLSLLVRWRSGKVTRMDNVRPNGMHEVFESDASTETPGERRDPEPWFEDQSGLLSHQHLDVPVDDFETQPLLPRSLSQLGPGIAWFDQDGDGDDDLLIGSGQGGRLALYRNEGPAGFKREKQMPWSLPATNDFTSLLGARLPDGNSILFLGVAGDDSPGGDVAGLLQLRSDDPGPRPILPVSPALIGPMAMADIDGDADLDLFVGGRARPGRYPEAPASFLLLNENGTFRPDPRNSPMLERAGLVNGAVFSDLDLDGDPDLILAVEWGPLRILRNEGGRFSDVSADWGLDRYRGGWTGVVTGDFDGDGRPDLAASNWGSNSHYQSARPVRLYYGDLDGNGVVESVEAYRKGTTDNSTAVEPWLPFQPFTQVGRALPPVRERLQTFQAYAHASVEMIYGTALRDFLEINWLESTVFLNRSSSFEARPLPFEAQVTAGFGIAVGDLNGDGREDLVLAQNFFGTPAEVARQDGGRGLVLEGDGTGGFRAVPGPESGVLIDGEQRGLALGDYDRDGRVDLVVGQNRAATRLFRNRTGPAGVRLRLLGPSGNENGVGALLRLWSGTRPGPAREIHLGSGYWSQDSSVQVMHPQGGGPHRMEVVWPGGQRSAVQLPADGTELTIPFPR